MLRCDTCSKELEISIGDVAYNDWLKVMHYLEHELLEGEITENTHNSLVSAMMSVKPWSQEEMIALYRRKIEELDRPNS